MYVRVDVGDCVKTPVHVPNKLIVKLFVVKGY